MTNDIDHLETISGRATGPTALGRHAHKTIQATIDTDENGDGSATVEFAADGVEFDNTLTRHAFDAEPWVALDDTADPAASVENVTAESADVVLSGSETTDGTATVRLLAVGPVTP